MIQLHILSHDGEKFSILKLVYQTWIIENFVISSYMLLTITYENKSKNSLTNHMKKHLKLPLELTKMSLIAKEGSMIPMEGW